MKKKLYIDSSVISVLTARPGNDIRQFSRQLSTRELWDRKTNFDFYISFLVVSEISDGNAGASALRQEAARNLPVLPDDAALAPVANELIRRHAVPAAARADAVHIAAAACHGMDYLLTWNHKHINNPAKARAIGDVLLGLRLTPPIITRPDAFLEMDHD